MKEKYRKVLTKIQEADSILIGASIGLSISEGIHIFADDSSFQEHFGDFREKYGLRSIIQGCFFPYPSQEEKWAFFSRMYEYFLINKEASPVMKNLYELVKNKNYFVVTSNIDAHFTLAGFPKERLFEIEGNCRNLQCSHGCHNQIYPGDGILSEMAQNQHSGKVFPNFIPKCPECGGPMQVHIEIDRNFLRGQSWRTSYQAYQSFTEKAHGKKLVLLELGVGARNQMIKAPFMNLTNLEEYATYITFNKGSELYIPDAIVDKSIGIDGNIAEVLQQLVQMK
ncbi:Sir2 family NAD-dependent protein deacetylase [Metabacillus fastidiosus]|uniref:Sir2 family NAD-dependent protein deacetylase n=1 Tax=Metabacillus fastidiosus TaxID=1458 RepID=UPI002DBB76DA|nr:Sir2 family NAD-dependent protein deacetylase [Metabacillus fastidiosus]MEC2074495.1 Sir2 family NAD-dependent protein deacetylase [Metabacillus fastidiosus]